MKSLGAIIVVAFLVICHGNRGDSANILALFCLNSRSHFAMFEALLKGLAARGHQVHVVGHFPQKSPIANYTDISVQGSYPDTANNFSVDLVRTLGVTNMARWALFEMYNICEAVLEHSEVQKLIRSNKKFDLIITELYGVDCFLGFPHHFDAPFISLMTCVMLPWDHARIGNPDNPSYIPNYFVPYSSEMNFWQRLMNTLVTEGLKVACLYFSEPQMDRLMRKHLGQDMPSMWELQRKTSLVLVNTHFSITQARPAVPAFVEVGGLHIQDGGSLPKDLENFLNEAKEGVIYFCFGSNIKADTLPKDKMDVFIDTFKELPYKVLWKTDLTEGLPKNVKTVKWAPQLQILKHPHVRVFITHGGMLGTQEAVYTGMPMIGIPMFADQELNVRNLMTRGVIYLLEYDSLTKETLLQALNTVINDSSYRNNVQRLSQLFRDRPQPPLETAIYWTEYVIRHGGASHLKSAAVDLPWYQYLLLDVIAVLLISVTFVIACMYFVVKKLYKIFISICKSDKVKLN